MELGDVGEHERVGGQQNGAVDLGGKHEVHLWRAPRPRDSKRKGSSALHTPRSPRSASGHEVGLVWRDMKRQNSRRHAMRWHANGHGNANANAMAWGSMR